ncbi:MAG: ATP-dependent protease ATPase subunit HslU [Armatimonadota bacterium]|nr:ATP-dependent protease ATPase subunit HslU [Armatimonadota bacterium]
MEDLTPRQIVEELDKYIIGQERAKRAVAIALRNRYRRRLLSEEIRDEVIPKNILMIGPTGVGKTEIARRLAQIANAPFIKVEATKFTEVGYVGRDVDSMVRDLVQLAVRMVENEKIAEVQDIAKNLAIERILDIMEPISKPEKEHRPREFDAAYQIVGQLFGVQKPQPEHIETPESEQLEREDRQRKERIRAKLRKQLIEGVLDDQKIEIEVEESGGPPFLQVFTPQGMEEMGMDIQNMLGPIIRRRRTKTVTIREAKDIIALEEAQKLVDHDQVVREAIERTEQSGIIFVDELDKIAGREKGTDGGPQVSREGVQRDILPIIEGSTVITKYGPVRTNHILFIAAGAFHVTKPSDLIPELQGRLPIRVELDSLQEKDFERILTEPKNALVKQYTALLATEGVSITFTKDAISEIARIAAEVNAQSENIGARRLHTVMERLLEDISFNAPELTSSPITIDAAYVREKLEDIVKNEDLSKYIL